MFASPRTRPALLPILLLCMLVLTACGGGGGSAAPDDEPSASERTTEDSTEEAFGPDNAEPLSVHVYPGSLISLPIQVGIDTGIFEDHGVAVEPLPVASSNDAFKAMFSGDLDVVLTAPSIQFSAQSQLDQQGEDDTIRAVLGSMGRVYYSLVGQAGMEWPEQGDIPAIVKSLEGKTIGVTALGADTQLVVEGLMRLYDADPSTLEFVAVGIGASSVAALEARQVDAVVAAPPAQDIMTSREGVGQMLIDWRSEEVSEAFSPYAFATYSMLESAANEKDGVVSRWQQAMIEVLEYMNDSANLATMAGGFSAGSEGVTPEDAERYIEAFLPIYVTEVDCAALEKTANFYVEYAKSLKAEAVPSCEEWAWSGAGDLVVR